MTDDERRLLIEVATGLSWLIELEADGAGLHEKNEFRDHWRTRNAELIARLARPTDSRSEHL